MIHKTTRSILSVLLAALLLVTSIPLTPAFADGGDVSPQSESAEGRVLAGDGTKEDPYKISSAAELEEFRDKVNNGETDAWAVLTANIVLNEKIEVDENGTVTNQEKLSEWTPIGNEDHLYTGTFDGNGKTISGLYIDSDADYQGLFGYLGTSGINTGTVQNLSVSGSVSGSDHVGGVVGANGGNVINCTNTGSVKGSDHVGGVVGENSGSVINSYNTGTVTGTVDSVGGVVGYNDIGGSVTNCYNTGSVTSSGSNVGGVVGYNVGPVKNCYNTGQVKGSGNYVGGVVGQNIIISSTVTGCYFLQTDDVNSNLQGIGSDIGSGNAAAVDNLDALCDKFTNDTTTWTTSPFYEYPVLKANPEGGLGTATHPYEIKTADQLKTFRDIVNGANNQTADPDAHAKLMNDIDLNPGITFNADGTYFSPVGVAPQEWTPIGNDAHQYIGTFDGNGKTISGLYIDSNADYQGLFGYVGSGGIVQNLSVSGTVSVSVGEDVGGVVGQNSGSVENCAFIGSVSGYWYVGGVVGYNISRVTNCYNTGSVTGTDDYVGGVVGENSGSNGSVENCYNIGEVSGSGSGGIVGNNNGSAIVTNCYYQNDKASAGIGGSDSEIDEAIAKDEAEFHSGEVAYLLGEAWGQNLMNEPKDNYPQLRAFDADTPQVYKVAFMNDSKEHDAKYANNGMTVGSPTTNPTKEGYTFAGWKDENDSVPSFPITVNSDTTYTAKWTPHTYSITASPSALNFGSITEGEERPAAQNVTITNTGNQAVTLTQPTANNFEITTSDNLTLNAGKSVTLTIQPKANLPRGSYSEQITISGNDGASATLTATFTVKEPPYTGKYSYEVSTSVGDHGSLTVDRYATEGDEVTITVTPDQAYKLDDLSVTANGKDVELTANSDGTYTFTMPSADVRITATFAEDPDWTEPEEPATDVSDLFLDIAPDAWYKDAVQYAYDNGLMTGVSATEFDPEATTTRAMIVSILARLEGVTTAQAAGFADVNDNDWYATAVNWAANVGVVNGYEDNTFQPNTAITREQLAAILMNYAAYKGYDVSARADLSHYSDADSISSWANDVLLWAVAEGLLTGVTDDTIAPQAHATRAQVAAILQRFLSE